MVYHSGILVLILNIRCNRPDTDTHRPNEDEGIVFGPLLAYVCTLDHLGTKFTLERLGDILASLADLYYCYLHL